MASQVMTECHMAGGVEMPVWELSDTVDVE